MDNPKFIIFHQPKTAGSYACEVLPKRYVLGHYDNYHKCLKNKSFIDANYQLVCIVRNPLDYYISSITYWCLDKGWCADIRKNSMEILQEQYNTNKNNNVGHPNYWMSRGFTERKLENILENLFDEKFIEDHKDKLSKKHHTYDNYVFLIMSQLDIGYYTFAFLDQHSRKKVSDIKTTEECREELLYIRDNFISINSKNISTELKSLCKKYSVPFKENIGRVRKSNRKKADEYDISEELIEKIKYKDRFMFEIFKVDLY